MTDAGDLGADSAHARAGGETSGGLGDERPEHERRVLPNVQVLVVEDDYIVAFDMQSLLEERGARVLGPATSVHEARALLHQQTPDVAILDVNLNGEWVFPIAEILLARAVPFVFATAYADDEHLFPPQMRTVPRLAKPVTPCALVTQLEQLLAMRAFSDG